MAGAFGSLSAAESAWRAPIAFVARRWFGGIAQTVCNLQSDKSHTSWIKKHDMLKSDCGFLFVAW
jgi:hypothetical protein